MGLIAADQSGDLRLTEIDRLSDQAVIDCLARYPGVGPWTGAMFLIRALGRPDLFPVD